MADVGGFEFLDLEGIDDEGRKLLDDILFDGKNSIVVKEDNEVEEAVESEKLEEKEGGDEPRPSTPPKLSNPEKSVSSQGPQVSEPTQHSGNDANYQYAQANPVVYINNVTANVNVHHPCPPTAVKDEPASANPAQVVPQVTPASNPGPVMAGAPLPRPPPTSFPQGPIQHGFPPPPTLPTQPAHAGGYIPPYISPGIQAQVQAQAIMAATQGGKNLYFGPNIPFIQPNNTSYVSLTIPPYPMPAMTQLNPAAPNNVGQLSPGAGQRPPNPVALIRTPTPPVSQNPFTQAQIAAMFQHQLFQQQMQLQQAQQQQPQMGMHGHIPPMQQQQQQQQTPVQVPQPPPPLPPPVEAKPEVEAKKEDHVVVDMEDVEEPAEIEPEKEGEHEEESDGEGIVFGTVDAATLNSAIVFEDLTISKKTDEVKEVDKKEEEVKSEEVKEEIPPASISWAKKLFFQKEQPAGSEGSKGEQKPTALIQPYNAAPQKTEEEQAQESRVNPKDLALAEVLKTYNLSHKSSAIKPRGLSNRSNWCFVNAILQALVACPPFFNLMKNLPQDLLEKPEAGDTKSCDMNILRSVHSFFAEFSPLDHFPKLRRDKKAKNEDVPQGKTLEPSTVYNVLLNLTSDTFKVIEGRQEDAEEFLTFLLNGLNDEMLALFKLVEPEPEEVKDEEEDSEDWQEVGPRNKSCVTRRGGSLAAQHRSEDLRSVKPPIADIFQGQMRSCVQISNGEPTATLQPFFTLQLDIQNSNVKNLTDALNNNFAVENLDGYLCSKTKQEIAASRSMSFEELPPILVLHLKRFVFGANGCQKLLKNIDFPVDLEIGRDILSPNSKSKYVLKQRQYKLFAVVYHNGTEATKGHYVADIYHTGLSTWIRCDDSVLKPMTESMVMAHSASSVPYILFYRRGDTMVGHANSQPASTASSTSPKQY